MAKIQIIFEKAISFACIFLTICKKRTELRVSEVWIGHILYAQKKGAPATAMPQGLLLSAATGCGSVSFLLLLVEREVKGYGDSHCCTYHRVVTHTQEAHHLHVGRN